MLDIVSDEQVKEILNIKNEKGETVLKEDISTLPLVEVTSLPSEFKGYPKGTKISYAPLTLGELEALNSGTMDLTRGIAMLLNSIKCNTLPSHDLYYWDVMYIGIQRKLLAFGDTRGVLYNQCSSCGNIIEHEFSYTEIEFDLIKAPNLPIITEIAGEKLEFSPITMKDFLEINEDEGELGVYARMIKNKPYDEALSLLRNCYGKDSKKVKFIDKQLQYGLKPFKVKCENEIEVTNPNHDPKKKNSKPTIKEQCNTEVIMEVRSPFEVVFPENSGNIDYDFEIQYGRE